jgi:8-amino-7-oxononanoate synthase
MSTYVMESPPGARALINGRWRDYFSGCSYLGLNAHPGLVNAATHAVQKYGLSTGTSRGGFGEHPVYLAVEASAARFWAVERSLYYVSGYLGTTVLLQGLRGEYDRVFIDEASHFSVWDGARAAAAEFSPFRHGDAGDLETQLVKRLEPGERPLVMSDGVFPVTGEIAPVRDYIEVLSRYAGSALCLDDAHATGVLGDHGRGTLEHWGVTGSGAVARYTAHSLSKALGGHGGLIAGTAELVERLVRYASAYGAASPSPIPAAAASMWALDRARDHPELREALHANVAHARSALRALGWDLAESPSPIICLRARPGVDLVNLQAQLFERGICVAHVTRYSSTPPGGALRIAIFATHQPEQIDRLASELAAIL